MNIGIAERPLIKTSPGVDYRVCTRCVMDTSTGKFRSIAMGIFNHCRTCQLIAVAQWTPAERERRLAVLNTVDSTYGHTLFELFNATYDLGKHLKSAAGLVPTAATKMATKSRSLVRQLI
jgi:hypothetical protein